MSYLPNFLSSLILLLTSAHLSNEVPALEFTGLLWKIQFLTSQLSLDFWVCLLVMSLGQWGLLFWSVLE